MDELPLDRAPIVSLGVADDHIAIVETRAGYYWLIEDERDRQRACADHLCGSDVECLEAAFGVWDARNGDFDPPVFIEHRRAGEAA